jgi:mono/diheme cytochrome c family protein
MRGSGGAIRNHRSPLSPPSPLRGEGVKRRAHHKYGPASMTGVKGLVIVVLMHMLAGVPALAQSAPNTESFAPEQIRVGAEIFSRNCSPCHGPRMQDPEGAFDLRTFPPGQHARFVNSVSRGKNSMPPWAGVLKPEEIEALWAYVMAGEKRD